MRFLPCWPLAVVTFVAPANAQRVAWWNFDETSVSTAYDYTGISDGPFAGNTVFVSEVFRQCHPSYQRHR